MRSTWETRRRKLAAVPDCEFPSCTEPASEVHQAVGGPLDVTGQNLHLLRSLCRRHHSAITAELQPGGWIADEDLATDRTNA